MGLHNKVRNGPTVLLSCNDGMRDEKKKPEVVVVGKSSSFRDAMFLVLACLRVWLASLLADNKQGGVGVHDYSVRVCQLRISL